MLESIESKLYQPITKMKLLNLFLQANYRFMAFLWHRLRQRNVSGQRGLNAGGPREREINVERRSYGRQSDANKVERAKSVIAAESHREVGDDRIL